MNFGTRPVHEYGSALLVLLVVGCARGPADPFPQACPLELPSLEVPPVVPNGTVTLSDVRKAVQRVLAVAERGIDSVDYTTELWQPDNGDPRGPWHRDSSAMLEDLIILTTDPSVANDQQAGTAAWLYRVHRGEARPMLQALLLGRDEYRIHGLSAISELATSDERTVVAGFACEAAWIIRQATQDGSYIEARGVVLTPTWLWRARHEFREAARLLGERDPTIRALRKYSKEPED